MPRIVSVWLPRWPILRFLTAQARNSAPPTPVDPERPFVLAVDASGGPRIAALNAAAEETGLLVGDRLADARAKAGGSAGAPRRSRRRRCRPAAPGAVGDALYAGRLAPGTRRTAPTVSSSTSPAPRICSAAKRNCSPICRTRLARLRPAGAACHRRYAGRGLGPVATSIARATVVLPSGQESEALAPLPIEALRLVAGHPHDAAPARLQARRRAHRQAARALCRALSSRASAAPRPGARPRCPSRSPSSRRRRSITACASCSSRSSRRRRSSRCATRLMQDLVPALVRDGVGARALRLALYRVDGEVRDARHRPHAADRAARRMSRASSISSSSASSRRSMPASASRRWASPSPSPSAWSRSRPSSPPARDGATARSAAPRSSTACGSGSARAACGGSSRSRAIFPNGPRRAVRLRPKPLRPGRPPDDDAAAPAPPAAAAEPAEVMALVPEGPPRRFRWRGVMHGVARAQGPERIASEWWRDARRSRRATTTWWRTTPAAASGSTAKASTDARRQRRAGSCTGCSREAASP